MKKIIPIFLLLTICVSHLNIADAIGHFSAHYKMTDCDKEKQELPEEPDSKEKTLEEEKCCPKSYLLTTVSAMPLKCKKLICYYTLLQQQLWHEQDIRPPQVI